MFRYMYTVDNTLSRWLDSLANCSSGLWDQPQRWILIVFQKPVLLSKVVDSFSDSEVAEGATELLQMIHKNSDLPKPRYSSLLFVLV